MGEAFWQRQPGEDVGVHCDDVLKALGHHNGRRDWEAKDFPISLPTFHYLRRGALLRWWDSLAASLVDPANP